MILLQRYSHFSFVGGHIEYMQLSIFPVPGFLRTLSICWSGDPREMHCGKKNSVAISFFEMPMFWLDCLDYFNITGLYYVPGNLLLILELGIMVPFAFAYFISLKNCLFPVTLQKNRVGRKVKESQIFFQKMRVENMELEGQKKLHAGLEITIFFPGSPIASLKATYLYRNQYIFGLPAEI